MATQSTRPSPHPQPIPPHLVRHNAVGKQRRPDGDPVAPLKDMTRFEPIPGNAPQQLAAAFDVFDPAASAAAQKAGKLVFHCVGDVGGVNGTATQDFVAAAMEDQLKSAPANATPAFFYILGDVVYYNGQQRLYKTQFYEPYQYYQKLIFAIPGNHDGDTNVNKGDPPDTEPSLFGFMQNFCAQTPTHVTPYRQTMTQPWPFWTLDAPFLTIIGLYSNVEGSLDARGRSDQQHYLETQLAAAPKNKKVLLTVHHPPFSLDSVHGGCPDVLNAIDQATSKTGRQPDAVLTGHVHNYQRFSRKLGNTTIPYIVAGAGGYANDARSLHKLQKAIQGQKPPIKTTRPDVVLQNYNDSDAGFLRITVDSKKLGFEYFTVDFNTGAVNLFESF